MAENKENKDKYVISVIICAENYDDAIKKFRKLVPEPKGNDSGSILSILKIEVYHKKTLENFYYTNLKRTIKNLLEDD